MVLRRLLAVCIALQAAVIGKTVPTQNPVADGGGQLLISDLSNSGCGLGPYVDQGTVASIQPVARRNSDGHYFIVSGNAHIYEFTLTVTTPCPADLTTLTPPTPTDLGVFPAFDASQHYPGGGAGALVFGAYYDQTLDYLCLSWTGTYSFILQENSFGCATISGGSLHTVGCWYTSNSDTNQQSTGSQIIEIPSGFRSTYGLGNKRWGIGDGGSLGTINAGMSEGLSLVAIDVPSGNSCSGHVDTDAGFGVTLVHYEKNTAGPTCGYIPADNGATSLCIGCSRLATPNSCHTNASYQAPTIPYAATTSYTAYSLGGDQVDWDPYPNVTPTTGYIAKAAIKGGIYDDGQKAGLINVFAMPNGFAQTTVSASPAPTVDSGCCMLPNNHITFSVASTSTGDGTQMHVGDMIWVQTCVTGGTDGVGCTTTNNDHLAFVLIDTVNTGTGAITARIITADCGGSDCSDPDPPSHGSTTGHKPVVGGPVYHGYIYPHGSPGQSRGIGRFQIYALSQLGEVKAGTRPKYSVTYNEDVDWTTSGLLPGYGAIFNTADFSSGSDLHRAPCGVMSDTSARKIFVAICGAKSQLSVAAAPVIHVLTVGH